MSAAEAGEPAPVVARSRRRMLGWIGAAVAAVFLIGVAACWWQAEMSPAWFIAPSRAAAQGLGETLENQLATNLSRPAKAGSEWTHVITPQQINAWLSERLPAWVENRSAKWPEQMSLPAARLEEGSITLAVSTKLGARQRVVSVRVVPESDASGNVVLRISSAGVGRLMLPAWCAVPIVRAALGAGGREGALFRQFEKAAAEGVPLTPLRVDDARGVRVTSLEVKPEGVTVHLKASAK